MVATPKEPLTQYVDSVAPAAVQGPQTFDFVGTGPVAKESTDR